MSDERQKRIEGIKANLAYGVWSGADTRHLLDEVERLTKERDKYRADRKRLVEAATRLMCHDAADARADLAKAVDEAMKPVGSP